MRDVMLFIIQVTPQHETDDMLHVKLRIILMAFTHISKLFHKISVHVQFRYTAGLQNCMYSIAAQEQAQSGTILRKVERSKRGLSSYRKNPKLSVSGSVCVHQLTEVDSGEMLTQVCTCVRVEVQFTLCIVHGSLLSTYPYPGCDMHTAQCVFLTTEERKLFPQGSVYGIGENNMVETDHGLVRRSLPNRIQKKGVRQRSTKNNLKEKNRIGTSRHRT